MPHQKTILGLTNAALAAELAKMRYDGLGEVLTQLGRRLASDSVADLKRRRPLLAQRLSDASNSITLAGEHIWAAWLICEPHMKEKGKEVVP